MILLVLLVWMICVRATRPKKQEKVGLYDCIYTKDFISNHYLHRLDWALELR